MEKLINELVSVLGVTRANALAFTKQLENDPGCDGEALLVSFLGISKNNAKAFTAHLEKQQGLAPIDADQFGNDKFDDTSALHSDKLTPEETEAEDTASHNEDEAAFQDETTERELTDDEIKALKDEGEDVDSGTTDEEEKEYTGN